MRDSIVIWIGHDLFRDWRWQIELDALWSSDSEAATDVCLTWFAAIIILIGFIAPLDRGINFYRFITRTQWDVLIFAVGIGARGSLRDANDLALVIGRRIDPFFFLFSVFVGQVVFGKRPKVLCAQHSRRSSGWHLQRERKSFVLFCLLRVHHRREVSLSTSLSMSFLLSLQSLRESSGYAVCLPPIHRSASSFFLCQTNFESCVY